MKIFKSIKAFIQKVKKTKKYKRAFLRAQYIKNKFYLSEYKDKIYIMCDDYAIYEAKSNEQSDEILQKLEEIRTVAQKYNKLDM